MCGARARPGTTVVVALGIASVCFRLCGFVELLSDVSACGGFIGYSPLQMSMLLWDQSLLGITHVWMPACPLARAQAMDVRLYFRSAGGGGGAVSA